MPILSMTTQVILRKDQVAGRIKVSFWRCLGQMSMSKSKWTTRLVLDPQQAELQEMNGYLGLSLFTPGCPVMTPVMSYLKRLQTYIQLFRNPAGSLHLHSLFVIAIPFHPQTQDPLSSIFFPKEIGTPLMRGRKKPIYLKRNGVWSLDFAKLSSCHLF